MWRSRNRFNESLQRLLFRAWFKTSKQKYRSHVRFNAFPFWRASSSCNLEETWKRTKIFRSRCSKISSTEPYNFELINNSHCGFYCHPLLKILINNFESVLWMKLRVGSLSKNFIAPNLMKWKALFWTTEKRVENYSSFVSNKSKYFANIS
jgi:hypothetical protein